MATKTWLGTTSSSWSVGSNWSPAAVPTSTDDLVFNNSVASNVNTISTVNSIDFTGYTGTLSGASGITIAGSTTGTSTGISLRLSLGMTLTYNGTIFFSGAAGGYIYSNGKTILSPITFNNATGIWSNQDALNTSTTVAITTGTLTAGASITTGGLFTHTAGTLNLGSYTHNLFSFNSNNANVRTINFGTSTLNITGNATTVWSTSTITSLTVSGTTPTINFTYSGSTGTRLITMGALSEANSIIVNISAGSDAITLAGASFKSLNFTGYSGACPLGNNTIYKDLTLSATQTIATSGTLTFAGTSVTQTITSNGITIPTATLTINSATTTVQNSGALTTTGVLTLTTGTLNINANLTIGATSAFTFTAGTINANNGANITSGTFSSSAANVRTLNMGNGNWTLTSTSIVWVISALNMTLNCGQSKIIISNTSVLSTTFSSTGSLTYYTIEYARGGGAGNLIFATTTNTTITNFIDNTSTAAHSIQFASGQWNFYKFNVRGTAGALVTISRSGTTSPIIAKVGQGIVPYCDYLNIISTGFTASPATTWYAGANSTGSGGGWVMTAAPSSQSTLGVGGVG